jgi:DNA-binding CsgD family transcriptional regulator
LRGEFLRDLFGLTATEARLADCLLEGNGLQDAADTLKITWSTTRFHLKRIFAKTGTCRQTELMRLMWSLPGQIA